MLYVVVLYEIGTYGEVEHESLLEDYLLRVSAGGRFSLSAETGFINSINLGIARGGIRIP